MTPMMIRLTDTEGKPVVINTLLIEAIQGSAIIMNSGHVYVVREGLDEILHTLLVPQQGG